ncbi:MAG TPA: DUF58 domain-containing protein [Kofleriaceae bacterium]
MSARSARIWALIGPALLVVLVTLSTRDKMIYTAGQILLALWITSLGALLILALDAHRLKQSVWERVDVLTSTGAALHTSGACALLLSAAIGWASLSVVGVLGVGAVYLAVIWTALVASSDVPWRHAQITRSITPERAVEGEPLREEIRISNVKIAAGMRLFITGRAMKHGAVSRYSVDARSSNADVRLESELGPAQRGEHHAPALELWLADIFGLTRSSTVRRAEITFTVLPKPMTVDNAQQLLGEGGDAELSTPAHAIPTEGSFRIREYVEGDDTRRIHWMRSLQQNRLIVRLPDEIPPADPEVRLILDNELEGVDGLTCRAPAEMLDALVRVWLGIGKALADRGTRVTLVAAVRSGDAIKPVERTLVARASRGAATQLGARVAWQATIPLAWLVEARGKRQVIVSCRPRRVERDSLASWVVVPEVAWTKMEAPVSREPAVRYAFPAGSAENRGSRRADAQREAATRWHDLAVFSQVVCWTEWQRFAGDHVARRDGDRAVLEVIP